MLHRTKNEVACRDDPCPIPTARAARLALRLGGLVRNYGAKTVAQILTRTYRGKIDANKIALEIAKEATGVAALEICFKG